MLAPYRVMMDDGVYYWLSLEHGTPDEARSVIMGDIGEEDPDDYKVASIAPMSEEDARKAVIHTDDGPNTNVWDENVTATRPCVLACTEY